MNTTEIATKFAAMSTDEIETWLADESGDGATVIAVLKAASEDDAGAEWMLRCILSNDGRSLRLAAADILAD